MEHAHQWGDASPGPWSAAGPHAFFPALGGLMFILFAIALITAVVLMRRGVIGPPPWIAARQQAPELEARRVLAERFAAGEIGSDEFLERASVLNWTPGVEPVPRSGRKRR